MISEVDIEDWDEESQKAYLKWAKDYGLEQEPVIGMPSQAAAWRAAITWVTSRMKSGGNHER